MNAVGQILVRGVNWLGDAVMTMPALQRLREHFPSARITLLTVRKLADLWLCHPAADQVWAVGDEGLWTVARRLRRGRFDLGVIFPNSFRSAFELWLGGVRERIGYAANGRSPLLSRPVSRPSRFVPMRKRSVTEIKRLIAGSASSPLDQSPQQAATHHTDHYLHLVSAVGASAMPCPPVMAVVGKEQLSVRGRFGLTNDVTWLGVNPGAEYGPAKRWPAERFAAVAREVAAWPGWGVVIFGARADQPTACAIATELARGGNRAGEPRLVNLAGRTSLRELCAALSVCRVLVTNDTGPMHLAAALGVPVVSVFGSTSPELTGPGLPGDEHHEIVRSSPPCAPCFLRECPIDLRCLTAVQPSAVLAAVTRLVARTESARAAG